MFKEIFRNFSIVFVSTNFQSLVRFILHISIAKFLGPRVYGHYVLMMSIINYASLSNLGIINGLRRQIPYYKGSGDLNAINLVKSQAFWVALIIPAVVMALLFSFTSKFFLGMIPDIDFNIKVAWIFVFFIVVFCSVFGYFPALSFADKNFKKEMIYHNKLVLTTLILAIPGTCFFGLAGIMGAWLLSYGLNILMGLRKVGIPDFKFDLKESKKLLAIGIPMMCTGIIGGIYFNLDKFMIGAFLGTTRVGYYGTAILIMIFMKSLPAMLAGVLFPDMAHRFGQNNNPEDIRQIWWQPLYAMAIMIPIFLPMIYFGMEYVFYHFFLNYLPGLAVAKIIVMGVFFLMIDPFTGWAFLAIGKQVYSLWITGLNMCIAFLLNLAAIKMGYGITGVALATIVTFIFSFICSNYLLMKWLHFSKKEIFMKFALLSGAYLFTATLILAAEYLWVGDGQPSFWPRIIIFTLISFFVIVFLGLTRPYRGQLSYLKTKIIRNH